MRIEVLGSGGAMMTPRPFCECHVCGEARAKGGRYSRLGPAYYIHDISLLIDTPEEIGVMLNRSNIPHVTSVIYSHWHPDHTKGMRVWEANSRAWDFPPEITPTTMYLPEQVAEDFKNRDGLENIVNYLQGRGYINPIVLADGDALEIEDVRITPFRVAEDYVYAFLFEQGTERILIAPDELFEWQPPTWLGTLDLAILPVGVMEFHPLTGARQIPAEHPVLNHEATFRDTLEMIRQMKPKRTILGHLSAMDNLTYDDYVALETKLQAEQPDLGRVEFAYDQMVIE